MNAAQQLAKLARLAGTAHRCACARLLLCTATTWATGAACAPQRPGHASVRLVHVPDMQLLMALHDLGETELCTKESCHKLAWTLDACLKVRWAWQPRPRAPLARFFLGGGGGPLRDPI